MAEAQIKRSKMPPCASRAWSSETLQDDLRDDMLILDPLVGLGLQLPDTLQIDIAGVRWGNHPLGHPPSVIGPALLAEWFAHCTEAEATRAASTAWAVPR